MNHYNLSSNLEHAAQADNLNSRVMGWSFAVLLLVLIALTAIPSASFAAICEGGGAVVTFCRNDADCAGIGTETCVGTPGTCTENTSPSVPAPISCNFDFQCNANGFFTRCGANGECVRSCRSTATPADCVINDGGFVNVGPCDETLLVELKDGSFKAFGRDGSVLLKWETVIETDIAAFYVQRTDEEGNQITLEKQPKGEGGNGHTYLIKDGAVESGATYEYQLYYMNLSGVIETLSEDSVEATVK